MAELNNDIRGLEELESAVIAKAIDQKDNIEELSEKKVAEIEANTKKQIQWIESDMQAKTDQKIEEDSKRFNSLATVDERMAKLKFKQGYASKILEEALKKLETEDEAKKLERYKDLLPDEIDEEMLITPAEGETALIKQLIKDLSLEDKLKVNPQEAGFRGGFILETATFRDDRSYRSIFRQNESDLRALALSTLFQEED